MTWLFLVRINQIRFDLQFTFGNIELGNAQRDKAGLTKGANHRKMRGQAIDQIVVPNARAALSRFHSTGCIGTGDLTDQPSTGRQ